jgi:glyoxalase/bleomycin resistance protein/dioxygenase superfamily protein
MAERVFPGPAGTLVGRPVGQIGIVVRDLESSCRRYSALWQCGPWRIYTYSPEILSQQSYRGEPSRFAMRIGLNPTTPQIELLQPLEGPSVFDGWLERRGEGLHHLAAYVEDADEAIASMTSCGYSVVQEGRGFGVGGDGAFVYFDTEHDLGYLLEVVQPPTTRREPELVIP